jgi:hypothetical protein
MTLVYPVVVSVLRERGEDAAYAESEGQGQRFMSLSVDHQADAYFLRRPLERHRRMGFDGIRQ